MYILPGWVPLPHQRYPHLSQTWNETLISASLLLCSLLFPKAHGLNDPRSSHTTCLPSASRSMIPYIRGKMRCVSTDVFPNLRQVCLCRFTVLGRCCCT
ncbi:hypothetical protein CABS01_04619 [Colletotrichum abscissum]|uniref:uncharacterized protein n=1 Tax=Colletotrichum abscissum TaxID=1671311 RepID=UPI0027D4ABB1|nr:uncharacterized protein CABS01_04619 [Colletotrichum abscissum]KAK1471976.1 hypothetical protein CABS01_04619 [Colletotrichum abscissum]